MNPVATWNGNFSSVLIILGPELDNTLIPVKSV